MENTSQWEIALLIGIPIAAFLFGLTTQALISGMALRRKHIRIKNELSIVARVLCLWIGDDTGRIADA